MKGGTARLNAAVLASSEREVHTALKSPAFRFYPKDFLTDENVALMCLDEVGAYIVLLCHCWLEGSIPMDKSKLARLCKVTDEEMARIWPAIEGCFSIDKKDPQRVVSLRLEIERRKQRDWARKSAEGGRRSGKSRKEKKIPAEPETKGGSTLVEPKPNIALPLPVTSSNGCSP